MKFINFCNSKFHKHTLSTESQNSIKMAEKFIALTMFQKSQDYKYFLLLDLFIQGFYGTPYSLRFCPLELFRHTNCNL